MIEKDIRVNNEFYVCPVFNQAIEDDKKIKTFHVDNMCAEYDSKIHIQPILGDIRDKNILHSVFNSFKPDVVLHAAAYKHVPMQEINPWEAVNTNIQGTIKIIKKLRTIPINKLLLL